MKKRIVLSLLMVVMFVMTIFAGCSGKTSGGSANEAGKDSVKKGKEVKIGVINFDYSGAAGTKLKQYLEYLQKDEALNVKFIFSVSQPNDQEHLAAVEALITQGVDGIISGLDSAQDAVVKACAEAEVYYANFNSTSVPDTFDKVKDNKYFLGQVADGKADASFLGSAAADVVMTNGYKHVGITSFPQKMILGQAKADAAFRKRMKELDTKGTVEIYTTHEHFFDGKGIDTYINSHPEMDALVGLGAGLQFDFPNIVSANKKGKVKLVAVGMLTDDTTLKEYRDGNIVMGAICNVEAVAAPVALIIDAVNGNKYPDYKGAEQLDTVSMIIKSGKDVDDLMNYTYFGKGQPLISAEDLRNLMVTFNKDAKYADLKAKLLKLDLFDAIKQNKK